MIAIAMVLGLLIIDVLAILWCARNPKKKPVWEYGTVGTIVRARRDKRTGAVEFVLWEKGDRLDGQDVWHAASSTSYFAVTFQSEAA